MQGRAARWNAKRGLFNSLNEFLTSDTSRTHLVSFCSPLGSGGWRGVFRDGPVFPCTHMHPLPQDAGRQPITQRHYCLLNLTPAASDLSRRSASWAFITVHHPSAWLWFQWCYSQIFVTNKQAMTELCLESVALSDARSLQNCFVICKPENTSLKSYTPNIIWLSTTLGFHSCSIVMSAAFKTRS